MSPIISLLLSLLVFLLFCAIAWWFITNIAARLGLNARMQNLVLAIVLLIGFLVFLQYFGMPFFQRGRP